MGLEGETSLTSPLASRDLAGSPFGFLGVGERGGYASRGLQNRKPSPEGGSGSRFRPNYHFGPGDAATPPSSSVSPPSCSRRRSPSFVAVLG